MGDVEKGSGEDLKRVYNGKCHDVGSSEVVCLAMKRDTKIMANKASPTSIAPPALLG